MGMGRGLHGLVCACCCRHCALNVFGTVSLVVTHIRDMLCWFWVGKILSFFGSPPSYKCLHCDRWKQCENCV